jgi:FkbM family methyltransferase
LPRLDLLEVLLVMVLTAVVSVVVARDYGRRDEDGWLRAAYGSTHWSHGPEEWIVRDFFQDRRGGVFVDVGSADAREGSNTYYLEAHLGWSGIAVDALAEYGPTYSTHRPKTQFFPLFVGDHSDDRAVIYVANRQTEVSSVSRDFTTFYAGEDDVTARSVPTITLNDLLVKSNVTHVDFLSMDIELAEPMALAGFDLVKYTPALVTVEAHPPIRQLLIDYFVERGYTVVGKYLWVDPANIWFMPKR